MTRMNLVLGILMCCVQGAWAHIFPVRSDPRVGAKLNAPPDHITILFDGALEPVFSTIQVENSDATQVDKKDSHIEATDPKKLTVALRPGLTPGEYRVKWVAVARDGHRTTGHFSFYIVTPAPVRHARPMPSMVP